jgi:hypothetical protein
MSAFRSDRGARKPYTVSRLTLDQPHLRSQIFSSVPHREEMQMVNGYTTRLQQLPELI